MPGGNQSPKVLVFSWTVASLRLLETQAKESEIKRY